MYSILSLVSGKSGIIYNTITSWHFDLANSDGGPFCRQFHSFVYESAIVSLREARGFHADASPMLVAESSTFCEKDEKPLLEFVWVLDKQRPLEVELNRLRILCYQGRRSKST